LFYGIANGQDGNTYEAGFGLGFASFQTDYGERFEIKSSLTGNVGFSGGGLFYVNFFERRRLWSDKGSFFNSHFKVKGEISYMQTKLEHFGKYVEGTSATSTKLKAMHGTSSLINVGGLLEFHPYELYDFTINRYSKFDPYIGLGVMVHYSNPTLTSDLGDYTTDPSILITKYQNDAIFIDPKLVISLPLSLGTRMKIGDYSDIVLDTKWQYFLNNKIDGLDPKDSSNKFNDWVYTVSIGYVIQID
jgi:hypothetical protein